MNCWRCGTTLMLVVYPPSIRHEDSIIPSYYEDHLLERVSLLELRLSQMTERMSLALDLMLKQAKTIQADHALLKNILEILSTYGIAESEKLDLAESENAENLSAEAAAKSTKEKRIAQIFADHDTPNAELFKHLVSEGIRLLEQTEEKQAFQMLERAMLLSPANIPLRLFIAEQLFRADRFETARGVLEKAYAAAPHNREVLLLLGALYADEGDTENSRRLLSVLANNPPTEFIANYIWGMLAAFEGNWLEALAAFKTSADREETPELMYLVACVYFELKKKDKAKQFLESAVKIGCRFCRRMVYARAVGNQ